MELFPPMPLAAWRDTKQTLGARLAGWDIDRLACPGGITDPHLRRHPKMSP